VHRKVLAVDERGQWHVVEAFHEHVVYFKIVARNGFFSERKVFGHVSRFVISTEQHEVLRIVYLPFLT